MTLHPDSVSRRAKAAGIGLDADLEALVVPLFQVADLPLGQQPPLPQHDDVIANELHVGQEMAGEEHAHVLAVGQVAGQLEDLLPARRVHAVGRLVEDQQAGIVDQGRGQLQPLLHAGRVGFDRAVAGLAQADVVEDFMGPLQGIAARHAAQFARIGHEIDPGDAGKEAFVLGHETDGLADIEPPGAEVHVEDLARPGIDLDQAQQGADQGRLARPVGPEEPDRAGRHVDGKLPQGRDRAVGLRDVLERKQHYRIIMACAAAVLRGHGPS